MIMRRWIVMLGLVLGACTGGLGNAPTYPLEVQIADLRFAEPGLLEQSIGLDLRFTNPNPEPISASGLRFSLALDGEAFGTGVSDAAIEIPRLGETIVPVTLRVQTGELINRVLGFDGNNIAYRLTGDLFRTGGLTGLAGGSLPFASESAIAIPDFQSLLGRLSRG
ncbi:MAG: LEA type 2 family protein [Geminicoccaceae bacterium]|jgi:LEA14-like dessication related protein|nr:LEA type 2 family protein [Geminicoccaceae bacterium]